MSPVVVAEPAALGPAAVRAVAAGASLELSAGLLDRLAASRDATLAALRSSGPVYGVSTGMGGQAHRSVGVSDRPAFQGDLVLARSVGSAPWLGVPATRAAVATRLRTLLDPEAGASPALALALVALLDAGLHPAVPVTSYGAAGEIIPLAHLGAFLTGRGEGLDASGLLRPAAGLLGEAGLPPYAWGDREAVAFLQGVPVATSRAVLIGAELRRLASQSLAVAAAEVALVRAPRDPYHPAMARGDAELGTVLAALRDLVGAESAPRMLQAPVSFRVVGPAVAVLLRACAGLDAAARRALNGVTTSPALVDGAFLGTAGFDGFDLAAAADAARVAVLHLAELGGARLHRLMDSHVTGLPPQLSPQPGRQTGLVVLHKRAVGLVHRARRASAAAGSTETSLGHEDVQSFALEAMRALEDAADVLRDVVACELVAVHQARLLATSQEPHPIAPTGTEALEMVLRQALASLPENPDDRPTGGIVTSLVAFLGVGWADELLGPDPDVPT